MIARQTFFVAVAVCFVVLAGCGGQPGQAPQTDTGANDVGMQSAARADLSRARADVDSVERRYALLRNQTAEARRKGVPVENVSRRLRTANETLAAANGRLQATQRRFDAGDYRAAVDRAATVRERANRTNETLTAARTALTASYEAALARARSNLQDAYREYQIVVAYTSASAERGANVSDLRTKLNETRGDVRAARRAIVTDRNPRRANEHSAAVADASRRVQNRSTILAKRAIAAKRIEQYDGRLSSEFARRWLERARDSADRDAFDRVSHRLLLAQYAEQVVAYEGYVERVRLRENVTLVALRRNVSTLRTLVENGTAPKRRLAATRADVNRSRDALRRANRARRAIRRAEDAGGLLVRANTTAAARNLTAARRALSAGDYDRASSLARAARTAAADELASVRARRHNRPLARVVYAIAAAFDGLLGHEEAHAGIEPPSVDHVSISSPSIHYSPPSNVETTPLDISDRPVSLPEATGEAGGPGGDAAPERTVDFTLQTGKPTSCGLTCREVSVTLTNTGTADAHDVRATMTAYSGGEKLRTMTHSVGTLPAGQSVTVEKRISLSFSEANRVRQHGARIVLVVASDERTETFEERYSV